ncbi:MAG TPA: zinc-dependent alcohol dehydrogenase family protein [Nocardioidaceae bacterium]|nr:zinc-dependent alcohol dehydrogenase family protein [Nocardioidaceae bacterium]
MKALTFDGPGRKSWNTAPDPAIQEPQDAIVRIDAVTICGTDLHILKGDVPEVEPGRVLGHEAVGTVVDIGNSVSEVAVDDRVLVSCISGCGRCVYCRRGMYGQCRRGGGWVLGHLIDGVQAEYARIPFADHGLYKLPSSVTDEQALMLADILPTSYEVGVRNGQVQPGDVVAVVGAGPIGLAAVATARLYSPRKIVVIDPAESRLKRALEDFGADITVDPSVDDAARAIADLADGLGADVAIEAVGIPETFEQCVELVRPGGHVANIGVHGKAATLHLETAWIKDLTITTGLVDTYSTPTLLKLLADGLIDTDAFVTHRFRLDDFMAAYDVFTDAAGNDAVKVALRRA